MNLSPYKFVLLAVSYYIIANIHPVFAILFLLIIFVIDSLRGHAILLFVIHLRRHGISICS